MKTKKFGKKLTLNKQTISNFNQDAMRAIRGGTDLSCVIECTKTENPYNTCPPCPGTQTCQCGTNTCTQCAITCEICTDVSCPC